VESKEDWVAAAEAVRLLKPAFGAHGARMAICKRAYGGMVRSRAQRFIIDKKTHDNFEIPKVFWWAEGNEALTQDWQAGDFDTWPDLSKVSGNPHLSGGKAHMEAFGVSFLRAEIEKMIPASMPEAPAAAGVAPSAPGANPGGRPPADWWEDLLVEICFRHFRGELQAKRQADIERAMKDLIAERGCDAADSTIRLRAKKIWRAIQLDEARN
jgi:hypothetical protein